MSNVTPLGAGEVLSANEVLLEALADAQDGKVKDALVILVGQDGKPEILCSTMSPRDIAYIGFALDGFASALVFDSIFGDAE